MPSAGDWLCGNCGTWNPAASRKCRGCPVELPRVLDLTGPELAAAFRAQIEAVRSFASAIRQTYPSSGLIDLFDQSIDLLAARGANLCDVATGAVAVAETKEKG